MRISRVVFGWLLMMSVATVALGRPATPSSDPRPAPVPGENAVVIRNETQAIHFYPAKGARVDRKILFVPGDGGWRGWAVTIGETMAKWGYDVYGLDTKTYLDGFTHTEPLTTVDIAHDFHQIATWMTGGSGEKVTLVGWSEGAGLCVLGAAADSNKATFDGIVAFGLSDENVLGWHWQDNLMSLVKKPKEPTFSAADFMAKIAPLPFVMIQASHDQYVSMDQAKELFGKAQNPKRFVVVEGKNHRFDGDQDEFFRALQASLTW